MINHFNPRAARKSGLMLAAIVGAKRAREIESAAGGFCRVLASDTHKLRATYGMTEVEAEAVAYIAEAGRAMSAMTPREPVNLTSWDRVIAYARATIGHDSRESFVVLYLDGKNCLIESVTESRGTVAHAPVYVREIIRGALMRDASGMILIHNHPGGDAKPSSADITLTRDIVKACAVFGVAVHDHFIVTGSGHTSLRALGLM